MSLRRVSAEAPRGEAGSALGRVIVLSIVAVVLAATGSEAAVALGIVGGSQADWSGRDIVLDAAVLSLLGGGAVFVSLGLTRLSGALRSRLVLLVAPVAAALVIARFYSYDPYYAPYLRRMSDGGMLPGRWIVFVSALALAAAAVTRLRPRAGLIATAAAMWLCALTALVAGLGH